MTRKASAPKPPVFDVGDRVLVRPTAEHPVAQRGKVVKYDETTDTIHVNVNGYIVRFRGYQLLRG